MTHDPAQVTQLATQFLQDNFRRASFPGMVVIEYSNTAMENVTIGDILLPQRLRSLLERINHTRLQDTPVDMVPLSEFSIHFCREKGMVGRTDGFATLKFGIGHQVSSLHYSIGSRKREIEGPSLPDFIAALSRCGNDWARLNFDPNGLLLPAPQTRRKGPSPLTLIHPPAPEQPS